MVLPGAAAIRRRSIREPRRMATPSRIGMGKAKEYPGRPPPGGRRPRTLGAASGLRYSGFWFYIFLGLVKPGAWLGLSEGLEFAATNPQGTCEFVGVCLRSKCDAFRACGNTLGNKVVPGERMPFGVAQAMAAG